LKAEVNIDTQELVREIAQEVVKAIRPLLSGRAENDSILDLDGLAKYLSVTRNWIYQQTHINTIPHHKLGSQLRFRKRDIDKWLDTQKVPATSTPPENFLRRIK